MNTIFTQCEVASSPENSGRASSPFQPVYTCEVCKISMRSAKKLEDHVNHSPLHRAALNESDIAFKAELSGRLSSEADRPCSPCRQRLIYDGTKLFWRVNETLELHIYEAVNANLVTVVGQSTQFKQKLPPLALDLAILQKATDGGGGKSDADANQASSQRDAIVKYILARVQAVKDANDGSLSLYLQKQNGDTVDPTRTSSDLPTQVVSDTAPRRRHTYEDACVVQKEVQSHAKAIKSSRQKAERCHDMVRLSLDAFIDLEEVVKTRPKDKGDHLSWLGAFNRVRQRTDIEVIKAKMQSGQQHHHDHVVSPGKHKMAETTPEDK
ncbi:hypothetical protein H257_03478 [Aphanomyces astaci]|uniref:Uncharacterized protein n=1 Tax=Aphanomyces astaci TaxID=112090 RepID=W4GWW5_APHAT|nr:hypothetical protein H257_03478 [Aphanomyces astaci]ETV84200.1 hypothetical protein H257_03478 [Aphanomyces astaci]|eukprot:XP_009825892.1 hypothetical protein H257_03478 [Aphanomyces astaci]